MAGKAQKAGKSKKPQSEHRKLTRARCRRNAAQRRELAERQQELRHGHNLRLIKDGKPTPWQQAGTERTARRLSLCGICRDAQLGEDGKCPLCGNTLNLKAAWEKRAA